MMRASFIIGSALGLLTIATPLLAQDSLPTFPRNPANWLNSPPITEDILEGKGALLYFFEEQ